MTKKHYNSKAGKKIIQINEDSIKKHLGGEVNIKVPKLRILTCFTVVTTKGN